MSNVFGYKPDPKGPNLLDRSFSDLRPKLKVSTTSDIIIDLSPYCIAMNQYDISSCVGNGTCESLEMLEKMAHEGIVGYQPTLLSRLFVYNAAREQEGVLDQDSGTFVRTAFNVLSTLGVCTETLWPYDKSLVFKSPSLLAQRQALGHKIHTAYRIDTFGDQRLSDILFALQARHPVVFGTQVTRAFEGLSGLGPVDAPAPGDPLAGGHCMVIVGYDGTNFLIKNSWGTNWGAGGLCLFTPAYITSLLTEDIWVPTLGPDFT